MKRTLLYSVLLLFFIFLSNLNYAQTFAGLDFWVAFMENSTGAEKHQLHITGENDTKVTVSVPLATPPFSVEVDITAKEVSTVDIPIPITQHQGISESIQPRGVHVEAEDSVIVYVGNYKAYSSDAATAIPTNALTTKYDVIAYTFPNVGDSEFIIIATEDNTEIEITWGGRTKAGRPRDTKTNIVLNAGETYQAQGTSGALNVLDQDLTGTIIDATKPVAVYGGNVCTYVGGCSFCDHLFEQIRPSGTWGREYYFASTKKASVTADIIRVYAKDAGTQYTFGGVPYTLGEREYRDHDIASGGYISSNNPIHVTHYLRGSTCSSPPLEIDPLMLDILPEEQFGSQYLFATSAYARYARHHLTVVIKDGEQGSLRLNGAPVVPSAPGWTVIPGSDYVYGYVDLIRGRSYEMISNNNTPFGVYIYGYGTEEAYGFTAGGNLLNLNCNIALKDTALCAGSTAILTGKSKVEVDLKWFDAPVGGNLLFTGDSIVTDSILTTTTFYAELDTLLCLDVRYPMVVSAKQAPKQPDVFGVQEICAGLSTNLTAFSAADPSIKYGWFESDTSTQPIFEGAAFKTPELDNTTSY